MIENEQSSAIHTAETVEEKVSLSDRFGLWLGFHPVKQDTYFNIIEGYAAAFDLDIDKETLRAEALEWSMTRGSRSGRVAWQFIQDLQVGWAGGSVRRLASWRLTVSGPPIGAAANLKYWIDRLIPSANFKMKLGASYIARISDLCDDLPPLNLLTAAHEKCLVMGVCRHPAMGVLNQ